MPKNCGSKCAETATLEGPGGKKLMTARPGNTKYPDGQIHPQCDECIKEMIEDGKLMNLFNNDWALVERYKKLMESKK
jgi:hypothetical protein